MKASSLVCFSSSLQCDKDKQSSARLLSAHAHTHTQTQALSRERPDLVHAALATVRTRGAYAGNAYADDVSSYLPPVQQQQQQQQPQQAASSVGGVVRQQQPGGAVQNGAGQGLGLGQQRTEPVGSHIQTKST